MKKEKFKVCPYCQEPFKLYRSTQPCCPKLACINKHNSKKEVNKRVKEMKEKITDYREKVQLKLQEIARLIDIGLPCLATRRTGQMHGGHVYAKGGNRSMALNLHNIHRQSAQSNHFQNDDGLMREGLEREYGKEYATFVSELRRTPQLHYSQDQWKEFYKKACLIATSLKKENRFSCSSSVRIYKRNEINEAIGIYTSEYTVFNLYYKTA